MSNYYNKYIKYKNKYLEIKNKINELNKNENNQLGGIKNNIDDLFFNYISPHHQYLINNPDILYNNEKRNQYLLSIYINNEINNL
jgi:hypothetical protein